MASRVFVKNNEAIIVPADALEVPDDAAERRAQMTRDYSTPLHVDTSSPPRYMPPVTREYTAPLHMNSTSPPRIAHPQPIYPPMYHQGYPPRHHQPTGSNNLNPMVQVHYHHPSTMPYADNGNLFMLRVMQPQSVVSMDCMVEHPDCIHDPPCLPHPVRNNFWLHEAQAVHPSSLIAVDHAAETQRIFRKLLTRMERLRHENLELRRELHTRFHRAL